MSTSSNHENRRARIRVVVAAAGLFLGGCSDSPRWGAWSSRPTPAEIGLALSAPLPVVHVQKAQPKLLPPRRPSQVEITPDPRMGRLAAETGNPGVDGIQPE